MVIKLVKCQMCGHRFEVEVLDHDDPDDRNGRTGDRYDAQDVEARILRPVPIVAGPERPVKSSTKIKALPKQSLVHAGVGHETDAGREVMPFWQDRVHRLSSGWLIKPYRAMTYGHAKHKEQNLRVTRVFLFATSRHSARPS